MINKKIIGVMLSSLILFQNILGILNVSAINEPFKFDSSNTLSGNDEDYFNSVTNTSDGGFLAVGNTKSSNIEGITRKGYPDAIIVKYDSNGNQQWVKSFGNNERNSFNSAINTSDGGFIAVGYSESINIEGIVNKGRSDAIIVKYDSSGNQQWVKSFGGNEWDVFNSVKNTSDNGFITVGYSKSTDIEGIANKGLSDAIIVKYDSSGNQQWIKSLNGNDTDSFNSVTNSQDGGFVTIGYSYSTDIEGIVNKGRSDAIIVKYDSSGNQQWIKSLGGDKLDKLYSIINTSDGGFVAVGDTNSTDIEDITNNDSKNAIIVKYDSRGSQEWVKSLEGSDADYFNAVTNSQDGGFVAVGCSYSTDIEGITNQGDFDAIIVKYDEDGNQEWVKSFGGNYDDYFNSIIRIANNKFVIIGETSSSNINNITNKGKSDFLIVNYIDIYVKPLTTNSSIDLQIVADNSLELSVSTNKISFEHYNGVEDLTNNNLNLTVSSGLYYDLFATLDSEIRGTNDTNAIIDKANLKIKTSDDLDYKSFTNIGEKVKLVTNHKNGKDILHNINLKLLKDSSVKADTYNTNISFEVVQK